MTTQTQTVAHVTLSQLGGSRRLSIMIGARDFYSDKGNTLFFSFKSCLKANRCEITLDPNDTYTVRFFKHCRLNRETLTIPQAMVYECDRIYADSLIEIFERFTGLFLSLQEY